VLRAVDGASFDVQRGEALGLVGESGSGKTMALRSLIGLLPRSARIAGGSIRLDGTELVGASASTLRGLRGRTVAMVFQEPMTALNPVMRIGEQIAETPLVRLGYSHRRAKERALELMRLVGIPDAARRYDAYPHELSGGMRQRVVIATALSGDPKLLLCDEPTVGVDPQSRNAIFELLQQLNREGLTVIYSTHYMEEAVRLCSRIGIIDHGRILALGTVEELLKLLPFDEEIRFPATAETLPLCADLRGQGELATEQGQHRFRPRPDYRLSAFYLATERRELPARIFTVQRPSLESVFLQLTGKALRE